MLLGIERVVARCCYCKRGPRSDPTYVYLVCPLESR
uniref:Uncharacterized protein n=1 Tax=Arundo donax TaxID=35708 RepID=A0A0A9BZI0_ARUDO